jgi:hypothetical protein
MNDYQALDLTAWCNAGLEVLGADAQAVLGRQTFHGLPFQIGAAQAGGKCFIDSGGTAAPICIPIQQPAYHIVVAHRLLESRLEQGGALGEPVAEYVFRVAGVDVRVPIRERFEIGIIPPGWGNLPFRALPDQKNTLKPRYAGRWSASGQRLTESEQGDPCDYYLWAWRNPKADAPVESLTLIPRGPRFIVAAVTLGLLDEPPFVREGARATRIVLSDPADAQKPFDLDVQVDRGVATYAYPLPEASADEFIADTHRGWGEAQNAKSSPAYVEIAAIPSATVTLKQGDAELGRVRWGDVSEHGAANTGRVRVEVVDHGKNWVHVTVLDDESGKPTPCRVHFRSPDGVPYQPHGHHNHVHSNLGTWHIDVGGDLRLGQITYAYIDGTCQGWLPRGEVIVDVARGFEYEPLRARVTIAPGQRELTLRLKRWTHMNEQRWFSGDTHVHFLSTQGGHRESQGEDLNVVNLLQSQWGSLFTNTEEFTGQPSVAASGTNIVYATQENRQHMLGHLTLLGLKKAVMPWCSDGPGEAELGGTLEVTMSDWADQCHAQGGTVIIPHLPFPNGEPATLIATGRADAVEMLRHGTFNHIEYYRYLNGGYRLPLVGGTDKMASDVPVGLYRTYVHIPSDEEFNYDNWCRNLARGRTFLSGGPIIGFSVEGRAIGETLALSGPGTVEVEAWAESIFPIHTLQVVQQGRVVASTESARGTRRLHLKEKVKVEGHTWLAARCGGPQYTSVPHHDGWRRGIFAHTSPVYVACGGEWQLFDPATCQYMLTLVEGSLTYIREMAPQYARCTVTHHHGQDDHLAYLERPFLQARETLERRLRAAAG